MTDQQKESLMALLTAIDEKMSWDCGNKECWQKSNKHDTSHDGNVCMKRRLRAFIAGHPFGEPAPAREGVPTPDEFVRASKIGRPSKHLWGWSGREIGAMVEGLMQQIDRLSKPQ